MLSNWLWKFNSEKPVLLRRASFCTDNNEQCCHGCARLWTQRSVHTEQFSYCLANIVEERESVGAAGDMWEGDKNGGVIRIHCMH